MRDRQKQNARQDAWKREHQDTVTIRIPKGMKAEWMEMAANEGKSLTQLIIDRMTRE